MYNNSVCKIPTNVKFLEEYHDTTVRVCQHLCTDLQPDKCFGIFYDVSTQICTLASYTGESLSGDAECPTHGSLLYFRRNPCLGKLCHMFRVLVNHFYQRRINGKNMEVLLRICGKIIPSAKNKNGM